MGSRLHSDRRRIGSSSLGRFGKGFMEGDAGGRSFGKGRKLASGDLQLLMLALLSEKPSHGYEIIKALDERSQGFYIPSPGMVYPALTYLQEIGHATIQPEGARKRYHVTDAGLEHLIQLKAKVDALFAQFELVSKRMERVRRALGAQEDDDLAGEHGGRCSKEVRSARQELNRALAAKSQGPLEQQQRIVDILQRATAHILGVE